MEQQDPWVTGWQRLRGPAMQILDSRAPLGMIGRMRAIFVYIERRALGW